MLSVLMLVFVLGEFEVLSSVKIQTETYFAHVRSFDVDKDGDIYAVMSDGSNGSTLFRLDEKGAIKASFNENGQGPGELIDPSTIRVIGDSIIVGEDLVDKVHEYNKDLTFVRDHKTRGSGDVFPIGENKVAVWAHLGEAGSLFLYGIYDKNSFELLNRAYPWAQADVPKFVHKWGGLTYSKKENKIFAIYSNARKIHEYDLATGKSRFVPLRQKHLKEYIPFKRDKKGILSSKEIMKYLAEWSVIRRVYLYKEKFLVEYREADKYFCDLYAADGNLVYGRIPLAFQLNQVVDDTIWFYSVAESDSDPVHFINSAGIR